MRCHPEKNVPVLSTLANEFAVITDSDMLAAFGKEVQKMLEATSIQPPKTTPKRRR